MRDFRDKVAVVTGAASGIGRALAERFAAEGMRVVLADIEREPLQAIERDLRQSGAKVLAVETNVADPESVDALAKATLAEFGAVHVLCNNAGVGAMIGPLWESSLADWEWVLGVNLWGAIHGIRTFVPILLAQRTEAHVVNTASIAGLLAYQIPFMGVYNASKHAVVAISENLSSELAFIGSAVKVSVVCPGAVQTQILDSERNRPDYARRVVNPGIEEALRAKVAAGLSPQAVAAEVLSAIREERLYVLTHPEYAEALRARAEDVIAQRNPAPVKR